MSTDIKSKIRRAFDQSAPQYDRYAGFQNDIAKELFERIATLNLKNAVAVEVGCGTGVLATELAKSESFKNIFAYDLAFGMVMETKKASGNLHAIQTTQADAECTPFKDNSFDLIATNLMLQWVQSTNAFFAEAARTLKTGGRFMGTCLGTQTFCELRDSMGRAFQNFGKQAPSSIFHNFPDKNELVASAKAKGFLVTTETKTHLRKHENVFGFMRSLKRIGVQNSVGLAEMGLGRRGIMKNFAEEYQARYPLNGGIGVTYEVIYLNATLAP